MTEQPQRTVNTIVRSPGPTPPAMAAMAMTPKEIILILRRHLWLIVSLTTLGLVIGVATWYLLLRYAPKYTASTAIEVLPPGEGDPMTFGSVNPNKELYFQFRATKAAFIKRQIILSELQQRDKIRQTNWFKQFGGNMAIAASKAVEDLKTNFEAIPQKDGQWIIVSMTCGSPKTESALIVNEMVDLFLAKQKEIETQDIRMQLSEKNEQFRIIKNELQQKEATLKNIRETTEFADLSKTSFRSYLTEKLENAEKRYNELESDASRLQSAIDTLRRRAAGQFDDVLREQMERDPIVSAMTHRIAEREVDLAQKLTWFGENHRQVRQSMQALKQAKNDLAERKNEIAEIERRADLQNAEDQMTSFSIELETLSTQRTQAKLEYKDLDNIRAEYERLSTDKDETRDRLERIQLHIEKLNMLFNDPEISKVKSIGAAPPPLDVSFPNKRTFIPAGFMLGLMAGLGLAFAIELLNDLVRTPTDVMRYLRVPLLGMICHADEDEDAKSVDLHNVVRQAPYSIMSECYRQLRTNLKLSRSGKPQKILFVTSCGAGSGKTSVAVNVTATLIAEDRKVLFIDANFRRPSTTSMFPREETDGSLSEQTDWGLSNYLMGQRKYGDVIRPGGPEGLDIVDSGPLPSNPAEILGNKRMRQLLDKANQNYDYIIIDGPPLLLSDAKTLATQADGVIMVLNTGITRRGAAQRALRELREINANTIGAVLLGVKAFKGGYFHEIFRSYQQYQQVQVSEAI